MSLVINPFQTLKRIMSINLCCCQTAMAQQFTNRLNTSSIIQQGRGKRMPQYMRTPFTQGSNFTKAFFHMPVNILLIYRGAGISNKKGSMPFSF